MKRKHHMAVRSDWSEFSLRPRPQQVKLFQAGNVEDVDLSSTRSECEINIKKRVQVPRGRQRYSDLPPIEQDVLFIAASLRDCCPSDDKTAAGSEADKDVDDVDDPDSDDEPLTVLFQGKTYTRGSVKNEAIIPVCQNHINSINKVNIDRNCDTSSCACDDSLKLNASTGTKESVTLPGIEEILESFPRLCDIRYSHSLNDEYVMPGDTNPDLVTLPTSIDLQMDGEGVSTKVPADLTDDGLEELTDLQLTMQQELSMFEDAQEFRQNLDALPAGISTDRKVQCSDIGRLVWAKFTKTRWWPAIVIDHELCGQEATKPGWQWIMWFGDYMISKWKSNQLVCIAHQFRKKISGTISHVHEEAITEALQECARRAGLNDYLTYQGAREWGLLSRGFELFVDQHGHTNPFSQRPDLDLPLLVKKSLRVLQLQNGKDNNRNNYEGQGHSSFLDLLKRPTGSHHVLEQGATAGLSHKDNCLGCFKDGQTLVCQHPLFEGHLCLPCQDSLKESLFAFDKDGCNMFCCICGEGGSLYVCEMAACGRSYCHSCMRRYLPEHILREINQQNVWACFLCAPVNQSIQDSLMPREDRELRSVQFMNPVSSPQLKVRRAFANVKSSRQPLRVLTLGDCLGSVKLALESLKQPLEMYAVSERNRDSWAIIHHNHKQSSQHLGDVWNISTGVLEDIWPIDLIVATPPTDDLDVTCLDYEGFNGTAWSVVKMHNIMCDLRLLNATSGEPERPLYWMVETTGAIKSEFRNKLSLLFQMEPCMWDGQWFCPCVQPKLYWGNIPQLYTAIEYSQSKSVLPVVDECLTPNLDRKARVDKLQLTALYKLAREEGEEEMELSDPTSEVEDVPEEGFCDDIDEIMLKHLTESGQDDGDVDTVLDKQGDAVDVSTIEPHNEECETVKGSVAKGDNHVDETGDCVFTKPVVMDGQPDNIWIVELERLLGYPEHYTDLPGVSLNQRFKLLTQASNPRVLGHILYPLSKLY